jgi:hypothetical protein
MLTIGNIKITIGKSKLNNNYQSGIELIDT